MHSLQNLAHHLAKDAKSKWKITEIDIATTNYQEASMALRDMQDAIDRYLDQRDGETKGKVLPKQ